MKGEGRIVVIADDITGAAEIAGIAKRHGLHTELLTFTPTATHGRGRLLSRPQPGTQVVVIATDTRSGDREQAAATVTAVARRLPAGGDVRLFKKTDSALRGHIAVELTALMQATGHTKALLIAQNPSKGRVISGGTYYINGVPLADTAFRYDPEFPAVTSVARDIVGGGDDIIVADAASSDDIDRCIALSDRETIIAGAADCFEALLSSLTTLNPPLPSLNSPLSSLLSPLIIVCGSTQSRSLSDEPLIRRIGAEEIAMPAGVFHGQEAPAAWLAGLEKSYAERGAIVITVGQPSTGGKSYAVRLRRLMADAVSRLEATTPPATIIIEGGATAFAVLQRLGWQSFSVTAELSPGVVSMRHGTTDIILKPGSYHWGDLFAIG